MALSIDHKLNESERTALLSVLSQLRQTQHQLETARASFARLEFRLELSQREAAYAKQLLAGTAPSASEAPSLTEHGVTKEG